MVGGEILETPGLLGGAVGLRVGEPEAPVGIRDACGDGNVAEVLADRLPVELAGVVAEVRGEGGRGPAGGSGVVVGEREAGDGLEVRVLG